MARGGKLVVAAAVIIGLLLALAWFPPFAAKAPPGANKGPRGPKTPPVQKQDRDRDRIFDDLEDLLATRSQDSRVEVIVRLRDRATQERVTGLERAVGNFTVRDRFSLIDAFAAEMTKGQVQALARRSDVIHIERNSTVRALNNSAQEAFGVSKAVRELPGLDGSADGSVDSYSPADLVAAVIDSGVDPGHRDLDEGKVVAWRDFVNGRTTAYDDNGHGTHVAATIAGEGDARADRLYRGVAPGAGIVGVKVLAGDGNGTMDAVIAGIEWVVQNRATYGIEAINLSLGASGCADGTDAESLAVNAAHDAGLAVVVAAGNEGPGTCTVGSPGAAAKAVTVGAMADTGENGFKQAYFSSRGPTGDGRVKPDVSGPGEAVSSAQANTAAGYVAESGTSMATPFVTGVALLMREANPGLSPDEVKSKLVSTAIDWGRGGNNTAAGSSGPDIDYGAGRLDAYGALRSAGANLNDPPPVGAHELKQGSLAGSGSQIDYPISVPETTRPIAATLIMPAVTGANASSPDFDLYLLDPTGTQVASSEFTSRQEEVGFRPAVTGTYTLRVKSYSGGGAYFVDISRPVPTGYARPRSATPAKVSLVPAFAGCTAGNAEHSGPFATASCNPPRPSSSHLTFHAPDRQPPHDSAAAGGGSLAFTLRCTDGAAPPCTASAGDQQDVKLEASLSDVRCAVTGGGCAAAGARYGGEVLFDIALRITDRRNSETDSVAATVVDAPLTFGAACTDGACGIGTSADAIIPGLVAEQKRANWQLGAVSVLDGGPDGDLVSASPPAAATCPPACAGNGGEETFLTQGLFLP